MRVKAVAYDFPSTPALAMCRRLRPLHPQSTIAALADPVFGARRGLRDLFGSRGSAFSIMRHIIYLFSKALVLSLQSLLFLELVIACGFYKYHWAWRACCRRPVDCGNADYMPQHATIFHWCHVWIQDFKMLPM